MGEKVKLIIGEKTHELNVVTGSEGEKSIDITIDTLIGLLNPVFLSRNSTKG